MVFRPFQECLNFDLVKPAYWSLARIHLPRSCRFRPLVENVAAYVDFQVSVYTKLCSTTLSYDRHLLPHETENVTLEGVWPFFFGMPLGFLSH